MDYFIVDDIELIDEFANVRISNKINPRYEDGEYDSSYLVDYTSEEAESI